jgi:RNA recognition motif-containing protein
MTRLYVENISSKVENDELKEMFAELGKLKFFGISNGSGYIVIYLS